MMQYGRKSARAEKIVLTADELAFVWAEGYREGAAQLRLSLTYIVRSQPVTAILPEEAASPAAFFKYLQAEAKSRQEKTPE